MSNTEQPIADLDGSTIYQDGEIKVIHLEMLDQETILPGHFYDVLAGDECNPIRFQYGPIKENGVNGITSESLLAALIHRTKILNDNFPCDENKQAINYMECALAFFNQRTRDRQKRGVEGHNLA